MEFKFDNEGITKRVLALISNHNITAYRLCKDLKIPHGSFSNIKCNRQEWSLDFLSRIAIYFKISLDYLVYGKAEEMGDDENILYKIKTYEDELSILRDEKRKYSKFIEAIKVNLPKENNS
jgi:transcriptional regulator with XRE-family HTH domain